MKRRLRLSIDEVERLMRAVIVRSVDHYAAPTEPAAVDPHQPSPRKSARGLTGHKVRRKMEGSLDLSGDDVRRLMQASQRHSLASDLSPESNALRNDDDAGSPPDEEREGQ